MLLAAVLVAASATSAMAFENGPSNRTEVWDFSLQTRYVSSVEVTSVENAYTKLEDDLGWGFGFGYNMNEKFNIGFFMNWRNTDYTTSASPKGALVDSLTYSGFMESATIALAADWNIMPRKLTPYLSGAIGYTMVDSNIPADFYGYTYGGDAASYSLGLGLRLEVSEKMFFKVGYEYNGVDQEDTEAHDILRIDGGFLIR
jgi:opacity protein-like surface antigen